MSTAGRRFHVIERLGAGAFGSVYLAEQDSGAGFRRKVAVKLLHSQHDDTTEAGCRMRDEARILGRLSHRHIVTVLDLVQLDERWAVVMEYIKGADLERVSRALETLEESFPPTAALEVAAAITDALHAAYHTDDGNGSTLGVVHRDIKPSNVLITADGEVKVLDFGVARVNMEHRESRTGLRVGTERYMAPERILGEQDTPEGDVYATVATTMELLLGRPIGRTPVLDERHEAFVEDTLADIAPRLEACDEDTRQALVSLLRRGLHADHTQRPSPRELSDEAAALSRRLPGEALRPFARRVIARVDEILGEEREPVDGVILTEVTTSADPRPVEESIVAEPAPPSGGMSRKAIGIGALLAFAPLLVVAAMIGGGVALFLAARTLPQPPGTVTDVPAPVADATVRPAEDPSPQPEPAAGNEEANDTAKPDDEDARPPRASAPRTAAKTHGEQAPPAADPDAPLVSRAMIVVRDASSVTVSCGPTTAQGTSSVRITNFPAGTCTVTAILLGKEVATSVTVDKAREVTCSSDGGGLSCI